MLATQKNIIKAIDMNPSIMHFSCHGSYDPEFLAIESEPK